MKSINGWKTATVKELCHLGRGRVISGQEIEQNPGIYPVFSSQSKDNGKMGAIDTFDFDGEYVTWTTDGAYAGTIFHRTGKFNCTNVCGTLSAKESQLDLKFLAYQLETVAKNHVSYVGNPKLMNGVMADIQLSLPEHKAEQSKIAEILSTLDRAIEQTEALIAKQQRIKTGLMQDLLTKGIDEHGNIRSESTHAFKDSPLGRIPVEWEVQELKLLYSESARNGLYKPKEFYGSGSRMVHMPQMFRGLLVDILSAVRVDVDRSETDRFGLKENDLLFARRSLVLEGAGQCSLVPEVSEPTTFESSIIRVRLKQEEINAQFANFFLNSEAGYRMRLPFIRQVAVSGVSGEDVGLFHLPIPNLGEQKRIVDHFRQSDEVIRNLVTSSLKLARQKTGLMHDLLTGKRRVTDLLEPKTE
jgi:type I restriction enzyme S subunit